MSKSTKTYEERIRALEKKEQESIEAAKNSQHSGRNGNLFRGLGKDCIADQSAISLIICATGICWNQVVCKRMTGSQRISLKQKYRYFIGTICIYFRANIYYHISMKGECA